MTTRYATKSWFHQLTNVKSGGIVTDRHGKTQMESDCKNERDLPYDMITQNILTRFPIKSLIRFKSVSKQWYTTLSSSYFAQIHFKFPRPSTTESLLIRSENKFQYFSYEKGNLFDNDAQTASKNEMNLVNIEVDFDVGDENLVLVGSCNGLVCLGSTSGCFFIIWNPITREFRKYFNSEISEFVSSGCWMVTWGFGYVSAIDDYKIVRICKQVFVPSFRVHVFSVRFDKWTRIDNDDISHNFLGLMIAERLRRPAVLIKETLYWMGGVPHMIEGLQRKIISFDLGLDLFDTNPHLDVSTPWRWVTANDDCFDESLCVVKGCLSKYGRFVKSGKGVITLLKHPRETQQILLPMDFIGSISPSFIGFTGSEMFFTQHYGNYEERLGMVDPSSRPNKYTPLATFVRSSKVDIASYSPTLISPAAFTRTFEVSNR